MKVLERNWLSFVLVESVVITPFDSGGYGLFLITLFIPPTFPSEDAPCSGAKLRLKAHLFILWYYYSSKLKQVSTFLDYVSCVNPQ